MAKGFPQPGPADPISVKGVPFPRKGRVIIRNGLMVYNELDGVGPAVLALLKDGSVPGCCCDNVKLPCDDCCHPTGSPADCCQPSSKGDQTGDYTLTNLYMYQRLHPQPNGFQTEGSITLIEEVSFANQCQPLFGGIEVPVHAIFQSRKPNFQCEGDGTVDFYWNRFTDCFNGGCSTQRPAMPNNGSTRCVDDAIRFIFECGDASECTRGCITGELGINTKDWCLEYDESWTHESDGCHKTEFSLSFTVRSNVLPCNARCGRCA